MKKSPPRKAACQAAPPKKRILILDDHAIVRDGLNELINRAAEMEVCGQTGDAFTALELAASTQPDLALVDISIGGKNGLEFIKDLHVQHPQIAILALSAHDETLYAERVLRAGGRGYVMKSEGSGRLIAAIRQVLAGEIAVSPRVVSKAINMFSGNHPEISPVEQLSDRELEIFQFTGQGKDSTSIADALHICPKTVEVHRSHIRKKLRIATTSEMISYAARWIEKHGMM
jgi:DNA-binding NarL/FixJ family response regulator